MASLVCFGQGVIADLFDGCPCFSLVKIIPIGAAEYQSVH